MESRVDGILVVDKPEGITSSAVVREVKRRFAIRKAGHIGTLDPFATGILPIVINEGTKVVPFLCEEPKEYEALLRLGEETNTDDPTGEVISQKGWEGVSPEGIEEVFQSFLGKVRQTPSMFSAIKVNGTPLYRWARKGIEIERKSREVEIFDIQVQEIDLPNIRFAVSCSKGTYIRTLGREIGSKIGCGAHLRFLRRTRSGPFTLTQAVPWEILKSLAGKEQLSSRLISLREALSDLPEVVADDAMVKKVRLGREMVVGDLSSRILPAFEKGQWLKLSSPGEGLVAVVRSEVRGNDLHRFDPKAAALRPLRVFHETRWHPNEKHV